MFRQLHQGKIMKTYLPFALIIAAAALMTAGCSTPHSVARLEGHGARKTYDMGFDPVWEAVVSATLMDDLSLTQEDRTKGFISGRRPMAQVTFGDCVAIWVRPISTNRTEVEVVSRRVGAPVPFAANHEKELLEKVTQIVTF
jgi:hypothetical protein